MFSQEFSESFQNNYFQNTSGGVIVIDNIYRLKGGNIFLKTTSSFYSTALNKIFQKRSSTYQFLSITLIDNIQ